MATPIPDRTIDALERFLPDEVPWEDLSIEVGMPFAQARSKAHTVYAINPHAEGTLTAIGTIIGDTIYVHEQYADDQTAAGLTLIAHEAIHQAQKRTIPDFDRAYHNEEIRRQRAGEDIFGNIYELEAYRFEALVFDKLMMSGYPVGDWIPLGWDVFYTLSTPVFGQREKFEDVPTYEMAA